MSLLPPGARQPYTPGHTVPPVWLRTKLPSAYAQSVLPVRPGQKAIYNPIGSQLTLPRRQRTDHSQRSGEYEQVFGGKKEVSLDKSVGAASE